MGGRFGHAAVEILLPLLARDLAADALLLGEHLVVTGLLLGREIAGFGAGGIEQPAHLGDEPAAPLAQILQGGGHGFSFSGTGKQKSPPAPPVAHGWAEKRNSRRGRPDRIR